MNRLIFRWMWLILPVLMPVESSCQETDAPQFIQEKTRHFSLIAHTRGFGFGYQQGRIQNIKTTLFWQADLVTMKHPKEYRRTNEAFPNTQTYSYGKLNRVYMLRGGVGYSRMLTEKPYWGGVMTAYTLSAGVNISLAEPVFLYILYYDNTENEFYRVLERYDPDKHFADNIYGRGPLGSGLSESKIYPGGYFKGAFQFEYGEEREYLRALEIGAALDLFPKKIPIMAFTSNSNIYLTFYFALQIGARS
ncbi:MAG TPA: hypothetical protein P5228_12435 [Bacteroidales bacterium]|nr:hypothetical protein [Bacteroidales bacterium]HRZ49636.1 hypothetical protein [Bacteroidales bacterium]